MADSEEWQLVITHDEGNGHIVRSNSNRQGQSLDEQRHLQEHAPGLRLWYDAERSLTCAVVRASSNLFHEKCWRFLRHVSDLTIEDEDCVLKVFPPHVRHLRRLRYFSLRWSKVESLAAELAMLPITHLSVNNCHLQHITILEHLASLTVLDLSKNMLTSFPVKMCDLKKLREVVVSGNMITRLPSNMGNLNYLQVLNVSSNKLVTLPTSICEMEQLQTLDVSMNLIDILPDKMGNMKSLTELFASGNRLTSLPASLKNCTELRHIHLRKNQLTDVPSLLSKLPKLEQLNVRQNNIVDFCCESSSLKILLLDTNELTSVPEAIFKCYQLEHLSMEDNELTEIPDGITQLQKLRTLYLSYNDIHELSSAFCRLGNLRHLGLQSNKLNTLPEDFYMLHCLSVLNLEGMNMMDKAPGIFMAYREGIASLSEFLRRAVHGDEVIYDPKKSGPKAKAAGSKVVIDYYPSFKSDAEKKPPLRKDRGRKYVEDKTNTGSTHWNTIVVKDSKKARKKTEIDSKNISHPAKENSNGDVFDPVGRSLPTDTLGETPEDDSDIYSIELPEEGPTEHPGHLGAIDKTRPSTLETKSKIKMRNGAATNPRPNTMEGIIRRDVDYHSQQSLSRHRPDTLERKAVQHPGHVGSFHEKKLSQKRNSSKKNKDKKTESN